MSRATDGSSEAQPEPRKGFLEKLYLDRFDKARFQGLTFPDPDPRAESIISRYMEMIKKYPPAKLEKEGSIPEELMDDLKELGLFGLNISEEYGGVGLGLAGYLSVLRAMARTDMALALTPTAHLWTCFRDRHSSIVISIPRSTPNTLILNLAMSTISK